MRATSTTRCPASLHGRVDVLVANAPYVPTDAIALLPAEARVHEPRVALDGGPDGLDVQRRVIDEAPPWLAPRGHLLDRDERATSAADPSMRSRGSVCTHGSNVPMR